MATARSILILEHDQMLHQTLAKSMNRADEFKCQIVANITDLDTLLTSPGSHFDGLVLDLETPDGNGLEYCARLRMRGCKMPIIALSTSNEEADVIRALDAGANDYMTKPLRPNELLARLRTHLRIFDDSENATFTIGRYTFRPAVKQLHDRTKNKVCRLTDKETAILKFLYRSGTVPVTRSTLLDRVWGYNSGVTTHTLETHIYRLRQKIEIDPSECRILVTVHGGYQLNPAAPIAAVAA